GGRFRPQRTPSGPAAISTTEVGTLATTFPVCGPSLEIVWSGLIAQIAPLPTTSELPCTAPCPLPGGLLVPTTLNVPGSTRETLERIGANSPGFRLTTPFPIQTEPSPTARSVGVVPTLKVFCAFVFRSMREIVWSSALSAQTASASTARAVGLLPTATC